MNTKSNSRDKVIIEGFNFTAAYRVLILGYARLD